MAYKLIKDLDNSFNENVHDELHHLADIWHDQKGEFNSEQVEDFIEKIKREWSIETGLVEGIYDLDRGVTETLIKHGIREDRILSGKGDSSVRIAAVLHDHENVIDGLFDFIKNTRDISVGYIKELHSALLQNQHTIMGADQFGKTNEIPLLRGEFKEHPNNPRTKSGEIHQYCPPVKVDSEMDNLIAMHKAHVEENYPPLAMAAWLHHRFVQIHPFQDGNGRVARCLATLIFIKAGWFPLVIRKNEEREPYIGALEMADAGNLSPLINLFAAVQKRYFLNASGIALEVAQETPTTVIIKSAARKLKQRQEEDVGSEVTKEIANKLLDFAHKRMKKICSQTRQELGNIIDIRAERHDNEGIAANFNIVSIRRRVGDRHNHYPNVNAYSAWTRVHIATKPTTDISILFHGIGKKYRGVIACFAHISNANSEHVIDNEIFQINYKEPFEEARKRFDGWLDKVIPAALRIWHDSL